MKKIKYLAIAAAMILGVANANAQSAADKTFCFIDANGNEVADGSTVTFYVKTEEIIPGIPSLGTKTEAKFDLNVKNTTSNNAAVSAHIVTDKLSSGRLQFCFPNTCPPVIPADYTTDNRILAPGESIPLNSEWIPEEGTYGEADFTLQIRLMDYFGMNGNYNYEFLANGPKIKIHCIYADPAGIGSLEADKNANVVSRYNAGGQLISEPVKGINILRLSNGKTIKMVK